MEAEGEILRRISYIEADGPCTSGRPMLAREVVDDMAEAEDSARRCKATSLLLGGSSLGDGALKGAFSCWYRPVE